MLQVNETGVTFRSYRDGQHVTLTPESTVRHQVRPCPPLLLCPLPRMSTSQGEHSKGLRRLGLFSELYCRF
jgi:hypothetical protein